MSVDVSLCSAVGWASLVSDLLNQGVTVRLRVRGGSMYPLIHSDDWLLVRSLVSKSIGRGRLVLYLTSDRKPIIHRVIRRHSAAGELSWYIAADRDPRFGEWVTAQQIVGEVVTVERCGRLAMLIGWRGWVERRASVLISYLGLRLGRVPGVASALRCARRGLSWLMFLPSPRLSRLPR